MIAISQQHWMRPVFAIVLAIGGEGFVVAQESSNLYETKGESLTITFVNAPPNREVVGIVRSGLVHRPTRPRSIQFRGQEYAENEAVSVLVATFLNENKPTDERILALKILAPFSELLAGTPKIDGLVASYERLTEPDARAVLLSCLARTSDPRVIPLFSEVVRKSKNEYVMMVAAGGLTSWNIRSGVEHVIGLLDSERALSDWQKMWRGALLLLEDMNDLHGWGFPMSVVRDELQSINQDDTRWRTYRRHWKLWFEANKHRFPEWKPGDPLPEVPEPQPVELGSEEK